ncbi:MAG: hypothetical protein ACO38N_02820, partial [Candidatus Nanopelagicales bacterium]
MVTPAPWGMFPESPIQDRSLHDPDTAARIGRSERLSPLVRPGRASPPGAAVAARGEEDFPGIIDTNVNLGRWPFRRLPLDETGNLVGKMRLLGITRALAGSFEG